MSNNFNTKPHFPYTYGDDVENEGRRLSDCIVNKLNDKKTQTYLGGVAMAVLTLGNQAAPANAIPPEYGEAAVNAAQDIGQNVPPLGDIGGRVVPNNGGNIVPGNVGQGGRVNLAGPNINRPNFGPNEIPNNPIQPAWRLPGPPVTPTGQYVNTLFLFSSVGWICLNAAWGNPIFAYGCVGVVGGILNELRKRF